MRISFVRPTSGEIFLLIVVVILGIGLAATVALANGWRRERDIAEANERAALDTTRIHLVDSLRASSRLVEQREIDIENLDAALQVALRDRDADAVTLTRLQFSFDSVVVVAQTPDTDTVFVDLQGDTIREASFAHAGPPIEGTSTVRVGPRRAITLDSRLTVSPFAATYSLGCARSDAVVSWSVPDWVNASFEAGLVDPAVCNPLQPGLFHIDVGDGLAFGLGAASTLLVTWLSRSK